MNRRGFLSAMLAACAAPAIVKAENLMKIVVPKKELIVPHGLGSNDFTLEAWIQPASGQWQSLAMVQSAAGLAFYINGEPARGDDPIFKPFNDVVIPMARDRVIYTDRFDGYVSEVKVTNAVRDYPILLPKPEPERNKFGWGPLLPFGKGGEP